jgi:hypothetical protein
MPVTKCRSIVVFVICNTNTGAVPLPNMPPPHAACHGSFALLMFVSGESSTPPPPLPPCPLGQFQADLAKTNMQYTSSRQIGPEDFHKFQLTNMSHQQRKECRHDGHAIILP